MSLRFLFNTLIPLPSPAEHQSPPALPLLPVDLSLCWDDTVVPCPCDGVTLWCPVPAEPEPASPRASAQQEKIKGLFKPFSIPAAEGEDGFPGPPSLCLWHGLLLRGLCPPADGFSHSPRALPRCLSSSHVLGAMRNVLGS